MNDTATVSIDLAIGSVTGRSERSDPLPSAIAEPIMRAARCAQGDAVRLSCGGIVLPRLDAEHLTSALEHALRRDELVAAVLVGRSLRLVQFSGVQALAQARAAPLGICVDAPITCRQAPPIAAAIQLAASVMRRRSAAMWAAIDALATTHGNAEAAASLLGCSGQAVRERRARAHLHATADFHLLLAALTSTVG